jgi:hypothetical protein
METVFHDVPHSTGFKSLDRSKLQDQVHSTVEVRQDLLLADLSSVALRRLGVTRRQLIDTDKDSYPMTRLWASAIHRACPEAQGLIWVSRQDDTARAVVLFGDRIADGVILAERGSRSLLEDDIAFTAVLDLADRLGVCIVPSGR